jgi:UPF0176 protein
MESQLYHIAFYKFAAVPDVDGFAVVLRTLTQGLSGSILIAQEGINGMVAGSAAQLDDFQKALFENEVFGGCFLGMSFKRSACKTEPFVRMKIKRKKEIVPLGIPGVNAIAKTGIQVSPEKWRDLIAEKDVVLIDNRNSFEFRLGRFANAIDPEVKNFREFSKYVADHAPTWKAEGKRVAMYCTGGIRCEKTTAWMADLNMPVYQLEGGILNYFLQMPDAEKDWQGECFVFDNRVALDTKMQETETTFQDINGGDPGMGPRLR